MSNSRILTSNKLIESVRNRALIPDDRSTYTDSVVLEILNEEVDSGLLSTLMTLNEEHLVTFIDVPYQNEKRIKIPYRAVGNKLRDIAYVRDDDQVFEMTRVSLEEISDYQARYSSESLNIFYIEGDEVVFFNSLDASRIRLYFYLRPSVLVKDEDCAEIFSIDYDTGLVQLSNIPADFTNLPEMDFVQGRTPNKIYSYDLQPTAANKTQKTVTFNPEDLPEGLRKGDYLCKCGETPVPNFPTELHPLLAQRAAIYILEGLNDTEGLSNARAKLNQMETSIQNILEDRVEGAPQKINARHSPLVQTDIRNRLYRR